MKKALIYGAGNIGRGFIGKTFSESGYEVCFVDVDKNIVNELNEKQQYPVKVVSNETSYEETVHHVRAVDGRDEERVAKEIAETDIIATAVGVNVLKHIVKPLSLGIIKRKTLGKPPVNIIICENLIDADKYLRKMILSEIGETNTEWLDENVGIIKASIGRMVPVMTEAMKEGNPLKVWVEPYNELQIDKQTIRGDIPELKNTVLFAPFDFYIKRKLFIHNMGHAAAAYLGWQKEYQYIYECVADREILEITRSAMMESARALYTEYKAHGIQFSEIEDHVNDLLERFGNQHLGDSIERVGRDPIRKLSHNDRLVGAALYCYEQNIIPKYIVKGIAAGLMYQNQNDPASLDIQNQIEASGIDTAILNICGIKPENPLFTLIKGALDNSGGNQ